MKRFLKLFQTHLISPILFSAAFKIALGLCCGLLWNWFFNSRCIVPVSSSHGYFAAGVYLLVCAWFQYLALDGYHPLKNNSRETDCASHPVGTPFRLTDLINTRIDNFSELEADEQTVVRLCADIIGGTVLSAIGWITF